jgi:hypothetical protein
MLSYRELLLSLLIGRISKLPHVVRVRFILSNESFFVLAWERRSDWVMNALKGVYLLVRPSEIGSSSESGSDLWVCGASNMLDVDL